jgi:hypothetical protein
MQKKGYSLILAIFKLSGRLPVMPAYEIASSPEEFGWSRKFKLAIVDVNNESRQDNLFAETVAVNRGYNVKIFDNEKDALFCCIIAGKRIMMLTIVDEYSS